MHGSFLSHFPSTEKERTCVLIVNINYYWSLLTTITWFEMHCFLGVSMYGDLFRNRMSSVGLRLRLSLTESLRFLTASSILLLA